MPSLRHSSAMEDFTLKKCRMHMIATLSCLTFASISSLAQAADTSLPPGSVTWSYQCKDNAQCPTECTIGDKQLLQTGNYKSITISIFSNEVGWIKVESETGPINYIVSSRQLMCRAAGATVTGPAVTSGGTGSAPQK